MMSNKEFDAFKTLWDSIEPFYGGSRLPDIAPLYMPWPGRRRTSVSTPFDKGSPRHSNFVDHSRIDFSKAGTDDLTALYDACKPATFGPKEKTVSNDTYHKAKEMDLDAFSTLFDPRNLGILDRVSKALLTGERGPGGITEMELHKLNVYGTGDFFKPYKDTPREKSIVRIKKKRKENTPRKENIVGRLVVAMPTQHEGGQHVLRQGGKEWTLDFANVLATAMESSVGFVAFFGDVEHEVLPITSGYRVTLTYNLYRKPSHPSASYIPTPLHEQFKKVLVELVNDKSTLPEGGYLCCSLVHEYDYSPEKPINAMLDRLKGIDYMLAMVCEELGLSHSLTLLYRDLYADLHVIARSKYAFRWLGDSRMTGYEILDATLRSSTIEDVEGVELVGEPFDDRIVKDPDDWEGSDDMDDSDYDFELDFLRPFYRNPATKILEIRHIPWVEMTMMWAYFGKFEPQEYKFGNACMLITLDPVASRRELVP